MEITLYHIALGTTIVVSLLLYTRLLLLKSFVESKTIYCLLAQTIALCLLAGYAFNPDWKITLEYVKVFLNWPAISGLIALTLIYKFQGGISNWFEKISHMKESVFGQQFELYVQQSPPTNEGLVSLDINHIDPSDDIKFEELPRSVKELLGN